MLIVSDYRIVGMNAEEDNAHVPDSDGTAGIHAENSPDRSETRPSQDLLRAARLLPLVTVAAWIVTIFVPVLDSGNVKGPRITITSLGGAPLDSAELNPGFIAIWILIVIFALLPWLFGHSRWWSVSAVACSVVILLGLVVAVIDPPFLMWDGETDDGMPTGGMEVAVPDFGFVLWIIGSQALAAAGVCGWIGGDRRKCGAQA